MMITDADAIAAAEAGRSQLSNGYTCELDETRDEALLARWGAYDSIQRNIRGNHVALVDEARAGAGASLRLDANDALAVDYKSDTSPKTENATMGIKFKVDGYEVEVTDSNTQSVIERAIKAGTDRADAAEKALADDRKDAQAKVDALTAQVNEQAEQIAKMPAAIADAVKALGTLGAELSKAGVDVTKLDATEDAYLRAGLQKRSPKLVLDGRDLGALRIMWETLTATPEPSAVDNARAGIGVQTNDADDGSADAARRRYESRLFGKKN
jgi:hypothetical protein